MKVASHILALEDGGKRPGEARERIVILVLTLAKVLLPLVEVSAYRVAHLALNRPLHLIKHSFSLRLIRRASFRSGKATIALQLSLLLQLDLVVVVQSQLVLEDLDVGRLDQLRVLLPLDLALLRGQVLHLLLLFLLF